MAELVARHRLDPPPVLLPRQHRRPARTAAVRRRVGGARSRRFRETLTRARPDVLVMVGSDHFHQLWLDNMPQFLVGKAPDLRRQLVQRGTRVRAAADAAARATRTCRRTSCARAWTGLRPGVQQRAADRPLDHLPDHHPAAAGRPADRADLHQHLRAAAAAAEAVRRSWAGRSGELVESLAVATSGSRSSAPGTCRWSWAGRASSARTGRTRSSTARRSSGSPPATSRAAWPR